MRRWGDKLGLQRIPKQKSTSTNDFMNAKGEEVELKSVHVDSLRPMTIPNIIFKATDKGKRNIYIDIVSDVSIDEVVTSAKKHMLIKKNDDLIDSLMVFKNNTSIKIK